MNTFRQRIRSLVPASAATLFFALGWTIAMAASAQVLKVNLSGEQQVPPVSTPASGNGTITVSPDKSVSGNITVSGMDATAAHIHDGAAGKTGPVIIPLTKAPITPGPFPRERSLQMPSTRAIWLEIFTSTYTVRSIRAARYERS